MLKSIITPKFLNSKETLPLPSIMNTIVKSVVIALSKLPFDVLYGISNVLFFLQIYIIKYRKDVVFNNLNNSFPQKTPQEINVIARQHFRNFCDFAIETIKSITITQNEIDKRITYKNKEIINHLMASKGNVMVLCGHVYNWEWIKGLVKDFPTQNNYAVYSVPKNQLVNDLVKRSREQFGGETIPMRQAPKFIIRESKKNDALFVMVADQSPFHKDIRYDIQFLNQTTPVFQGFDKLARRLDMGVVYLNITRQGRGKFTYEPIEIKPDGDKFEENEIVHKFFHLLEENIIQDPANYMWTHKRWKYTKGINY